VQRQQATYPARVAVTGYMHEVNAFADAVTLAHGIDASQGPGGLAAAWEARPLIERLHAGERAVEVVEAPVWEFGASGPLDDRDFSTVVAQVADRLAACGALDAVVVLGHGAGRTVDDLDSDATFLEAVRRVVGHDVPVVVVLDFHANLSARMCAAVDVVVGYRTNPHVDIADRLVEAADHVHRLLQGARTSIVWARLPMVLPQIAQLTSLDEPLGAVVALGQSLAVGAVRNVSVFGGFSLADVAECGVSVCVTVDADHEHRGVEVVRSLTTALWAQRPRYRLHAVPLEQSVAEAGRAARGERSPVLLADVADNPGGGAPATSTFVLAALAAADVRGVVLGLQCDRVLVDAAWQAGVGARLRAELNAGSARPLAPPFAGDAEVLALVDAPLMPTRGVYAGSTRHPGRCCALRFGGIDVGVSSHPVQCADDDTLRHAGLDVDAARVVVVKSRGHFRAGFDHLFTPDQIIEVGAPGVATPELHTVAWQHLPRPVFPLDEVDESAVAALEPVVAGRVSR
jgi:microcystin degradation protein MlrC